MTMYCDTGSAVPLQPQPQYKGIREYFQVRPFARRVEIGRSGAAPNSVALRELKAPDPHLRGPVEIVTGAIARSRACLQQVIHERMHGSAVLHSQRLRVTVITWVTPLVAL